VIRPGLGAADYSKAGIRLSREKSSRHCAAAVFSKFSSMTLMGKKGGHLMGFQMSNIKIQMPIEFLNPNVN
jgi:hypothetical protein